MFIVLKYCTFNFLKTKKLISCHFSLKIHTVTFHIWPKFDIFQFYQMVKISTFSSTFGEHVILVSRCFVKWQKNPQNQTEYSLSFHLCAILPLVNANVLIVGLLLSATFATISSLVAASSTSDTSCTLLNPRDSTTAWQQINELATSFADYLSF